MDRRDSLKSLLIGTIAGASITTAASCTPDKITPETETTSTDEYGRTEAEKLHDKKVRSEVFLTDAELGTIAILCDIILPATPSAGSANDAGVPEFIEFIVKDLPSHQIPIRGGLMWLHSESQSRFNKRFDDLSSTQKLEIIDDIAFPENAEKNADLKPGIEFFNRVRNLTVTGYYTTRLGFDDLGYVGNIPNVWDGVPDEVLADHDVNYEEEWLSKCIDQSTRTETAQWDDEMNLIK